MKEKNKKTILRKNINRIARNYLGETALIIGTGILSYNIFNFSYKTKTGVCVSLGLSCEKIQGVAYYYTEEILLLISIGAILMTLGFLILRKKVNHMNNK